MRRFAANLLLSTAVLSLAAISGPLLGAQQDPSVDSPRRIFSDVGAGFLAIRRGPDGSYYVLAPPVPAVIVFDAEGRKLRQIPAQPARQAPAQAQRREPAFGNSLDVDASGRLYIAELSGNSVSIYSADGSLFARLSIPSPAQIVSLPHDQFAVSSVNGDHLISIYDLRGKLLHEFGELADLSDDEALNRRLNAGYLASDGGGNLYFAFRYVPEPTVRKYDSMSGYLLDELTLTTIELEPMAQSARQEIARAASGKAIIPHEIISALGVDPDTQELWLALGNLLLHFNNADDNLGGNRAYTTNGARMAPNFILVEKNRLLLGNDSLGIYEFPRSSGAVQATP